MHRPALCLKSMCSSISLGKHPICISNMCAAVFPNDNVERQNTFHLLFLKQHNLLSCKVCKDAALWIQFDNDVTGTCGVSFRPPGSQADDSCLHYALQSIKLSLFEQRQLIQPPPHKTHRHHKHKHGSSCRRIKEDMGSSWYIPSHPVTLSILTHHQKTTQTS